MSEGEFPGGSHAVESGDPLLEYRRFVVRRGDHVSRFRFAFQRLQGRQVLDYGSGAGFASFFLPTNDTSYVGVEPDEEPLEWSRTHLATPDSRISFLAPSVFWDRTGDPAYDLVMVLEVIEHIPRPLDLLNRLSRLVRKNGVMIVSSPNGNLSKGDTRLFQSPFHLTEFTPSAFEGLLAGLGREVSLFRQYRLDHTDVLPQLLKSIGLQGGSPNNQETAVASRDRRSHWLYRTWLLIPAPSFVWRIRPCPQSAFEQRSFSHLIAVIRF